MHPSIIIKCSQIQKNMRNHLTFHSEARSHNNRKPTSLPICCRKPTADQVLTSKLYLLGQLGQKHKGMAISTKVFRQQSKSASKLIGTPDLNHFALGDIGQRKKMIFASKMKMLFCSRPAQENCKFRRQTFSGFHCAMAPLNSGPTGTQTKIIRIVNGQREKGSSPSISGTVMSKSHKRSGEDICFELPRPRNSIEQSLNGGKIYLSCADKLEQYLRALLCLAIHNKTVCNKLPHWQALSSMAKTDPKKANGSVWHIGPRCYQFLAARSTHQNVSRVVLLNIANDNCFVLEVGSNALLQPIAIGTKVCENYRNNLQRKHNHPAHLSSQAGKKEQVIFISHLCGGSLLLLQVQQSMQPRAQDIEKFTMICRNQNLIHMRKSAVIGAALIHYADRYLTWVRPKIDDRGSQVEPRNQSQIGQPQAGRKYKSYGLFVNIMLLCKTRRSANEEIERGSDDEDEIKQQQKQCEVSLIRTIRLCSEISPNQRDERLNTKFVEKVLGTTCLLGLDREKCKAIIRTRPAVVMANKSSLMKTRYSDKIIRIRHLFRGLLKNNNAHLSSSPIKQTTSRMASRAQYTLLNLFTIAFPNKSNTQAKQKCLVVNTETASRLRYSPRMAIAYSETGENPYSLNCPSLEDYLHTKFCHSQASSVEEVRLQFMSFLNCKQRKIREDLKLCLGTHRQVLINQSFLKPKPHPLAMFRLSMVTKAHFLGIKLLEKNSHFFRISMDMKPELNCVIVQCQCAPQATQETHMPTKYFGVLAYYPHFSQCIQQAYSEQFPHLYVQLLQSSSAPGLQSYHTRHLMILQSIKQIWAGSETGMNSHLPIRNMRSTVKEKVCKMVSLHMKVSKNNNMHQIQGTIRLQREMQKQEEIANVSLRPCHYTWYHYQPSKEFTLVVNLAYKTGRLPSGKYLVLTTRRGDEWPILATRSLNNPQEHRQGHKICASALLSCNISNFDGLLRTQALTRYLLIIPYKPSHCSIRRCIIQHSLSLLDCIEREPRHSQSVKLCAALLKSNRIIEHSKIVDLKPIGKYISGFQVSFGVPNLTGHPQPTNRHSSHLRLKKRLTRSMKRNLQLFEMLVS